MTLRPPRHNGAAGKVAHILPAALETFESAAFLFYERDRFTAIHGQRKEAPTSVADETDPISRLAERAFNPTVRVEQTVERSSDIGLTNSNQRGLIRNSNT
uniref:Uncharacterized protein n=2 Tax=Plectus sambesii TaxID=2011161 RepID=A0A914W7E7_9BILA